MKQIIRLLPGKFSVAFFSNLSQLCVEVRDYFKRLGWLCGQMGPRNMGGCLAGGGGWGVSCMGRFIMPGSLLQWEILEFVVPVVLLLYREARYRRFFTLRGFRCSYTEGSLLRFGGLFHQEVSYIRRLLKLGEGGIVIITCIRGYELHVGY